MSGLPEAETKTVLAVDDNDVNLRLFAKILARAGYRVLEARTGEECLLLARQEHPQLILMDVKLPGMNGVEVTRKIKAEPGIAGIPVVVVTAYAMEEDRTRALEAGCADFMTKPFHVQELVETVRRIAGE